MAVQKEALFSDKARDEIMNELRQHFRPEFLNRVDEIMLFNLLTIKESISIVALLTQDSSKRLAECRIRIEISDTARYFIAEWPNAVSC